MTLPAMMPCPAPLRAGLRGVRQGMAAALMLAALGAAAAERPAAPAPAFVQFGGGDDRLAAATVGLVWPWDWHAR